MSTVVLTNEEILEGNKLIATFMDAEIFGIKETGDNPLRAIFTPLRFDAAIKAGYNLQMSYHSSWDWIMPVIDEIESKNGCSYKVTLMYAFASVTDISQHGEPYIIRSIGHTRITTAYNLVVKFINWYNQQVSRNNARPITEAFTAKKL